MLEGLIAFELQAMFPYPLPMDAALVAALSCNQWKAHHEFSTPGDTVIQTIIILPELPCCYLSVQNILYLFLNFFMKIKPPSAN